MNNHNDGLKLATERTRLTADTLHLRSYLVDRQFDGGHELISTIAPRGNDFVLATYGQQYPIYSAEERR